MNQIFEGDVLVRLRDIPNESVQTCVTSPPYFGLRDYGVEGQIGLEETPDHYVQKMVEVFREVRRVLRNDGTLWLNLGDSYSAGGRGGNTAKQHSNRGTRALAGNPFKVPGYGQKQLLGIPWKVAFALQADGWILRQDIIWHKPNPMPESVTDRCTKAHEYIFLLSKSPKYYFDADAVSEVAVTKENRPHGVVREREYGYNSKQKIIRAMWKEPSANPGRDWTKSGGNILGKGTHKRNGRMVVNEVENKYDVQFSPNRNRRSVWTVTTKPYKGAHFATFPSDLIEPCILAGAPVGGVVLDPFLGSGTVAAVAVKHGRKYIGIELNSEYVELAKQRLSQVNPVLL